MNIAPDLVQDIVFGAAAILGGVEIIRSAISRALPSVLTAFLTAASVYATFYL